MLQAAEECVCGFVEVEQTEPSACVEGGTDPVSLLSNMACHASGGRGGRSPSAFPPLRWGASLLQQSLFLCFSFETGSCVGQTDFDFSL